MSKDLLNELIVNDPDFNRRMEIRELQDKVTKEIRNNMFQEPRRRNRRGFSKPINNMFKDK